MSPPFARLGRFALLLLGIQGSVRGFPTDGIHNSSESREVELAQSNVTEPDCSLCGGGERTRHKLAPECNNGTSADDDLNEPADNATICVDTEYCNVHQCPVDGKWSAWKQWSGCSTTCGPTGVRTRQRDCEPAERYGGKDCNGEKQQSENCNRHVKCPVDGKWSAWKQWSGCSTKCGPTGVRTRQRDCEPAERYGGKDCNGEKQQSENCNRHVKCPVDGEWQTWRPWSACSASCGPTGVQTRYRECKPIPADQYGGEDCVGHNHEIIDCNTNTSCRVNGGWTNWSDWHRPSATCGSFLVFRTRTCTNPEPKSGGMPCNGSSRNSKWRMVDGFPKCPINGGLSIWSTWSRSSVTCGKPIIERTRTCTNPRPQYEGQDCHGAIRDTKVDDKGVPCPIHGGWSDWTAAVSECPSSKMLWEFRSCINPMPLHEGRLCNGTSQRQRPCEPKRRDGNWCDWGTWGACSRLCYEVRPDEQYRQRKRKCECPEPKNGGRLCGNMKRLETEVSPCKMEDQLSCTPPTRAPCNKKGKGATNTTDYNYGGGDYYGAGSNYDEEDETSDGTNEAETETDGSLYDNYDDYGDC